MQGGRELDGIQHCPRQPPRSAKCSVLRQSWSLPDSLTSHEGFPSYALLHGLEKNLASGSRSCWSLGLRVLGPFLKLTGPLSYGVGYPGRNSLAVVTVIQ